MSSSNQQTRVLKAMEMKHLCHPRGENMDPKTTTIIQLAFVYGSWNSAVPHDSVVENLSDLLQQTTKNIIPHDAETTVCFTGTIRVDETEDSMAQCIGDDHDHDDSLVPCPPESLPVLALSVQTPSSSSHARVEYLTDLSAVELLSLFKNPKKNGTLETKCIPLLQSALAKLLMSSNNNKHQSRKRRPNNNNNADNISNDRDDALRIFVAGDRSSVGKSSVCLGLLGNLVHQFGYAPSSLAYIKPATQCEAPQLVQKYCDSVGIACEPVGPLVYYKGFTRAFLAGETGQTSDDLLRDCGESVDKIARGKKIVLIDGVGFPAVGSICGTDNASVSRACGYPQKVSSSGKQRGAMGVVVVGGSGVGAAVDAFNLNATFFEMKQVPVMGGIFNKLSTEGFYSLDNCRTQITRYFQQNEHQQQMKRTAFGFVPQFPALGGDDAMTHVHEYFRVFADHVDIQAMLDSARRVKQEQQTTNNNASMELDDPPVVDAAPPATKRAKVSAAATSSQEKAKNRTPMRPKLTRRDIELMAAKQGAAPMA